MLTKIYRVTKASGETAPFEPEKLRQSLSRAGASREQIDTIESRINPILYDGIPTKKIYQAAFAMLKKMARPMAARYKLKRALMELGPSGYPFEKFIGAILTFQGYKVQVGVYEKGHCLNHEVDVLGEKEDRRIAVECKYRNNNDGKVDARVALYIYSRFKDLSREWSKQEAFRDKKHQGWIVTNTSFTSDAIDYANCMGLTLKGWDYPKGGSLKELIDECGLHPITSLTTLTLAEKRKLLEKKTVLCRELVENTRLLEEIGIRPSRIRKVVEETELLCLTK
jgi:hypothetical protein